MTGRTIAHFEILEKIGEGGMGVVYKARDSQLDRLVAVKLLRADKVADADRRRRFIQEARAASALNFAISPDETGVLFVKTDQRVNELMLIEAFR